MTGESASRFVAAAVDEDLLRSAMGLFHLPPAVLATVARRSNMREELASRLAAARVLVAVVLVAVAIALAAAS